MSKRTPRAHLSSTPIGPEAEDTVPVAPALVEHLERKFPIRLSGAMHPNAIANDQAEQRGQQQVIDYLRNTQQQPRLGGLGPMCFTKPKTPQPGAQPAPPAQPEPIASSSAPPPMTMSSSATRGSSAACLSASAALLAWSAKAR
jgi:hypothetical protein